VHRMITVDARSGQRDRRTDRQTSRQQRDDLCQRFVLTNAAHANKN